MNSPTLTDFLFGLISFFALLLFAAFLSFVSALYTAIDISKIDLSRINRKKKRIKKLIFVAKNNYFLFVGICFMLVIMHVALSSIILNTFRRYFEWEKDIKTFYEIIIAFFLALVLEIFIRFLADKEIAKKQITNLFFLDPAHFITYLMRKMLKWLIKPKKSFFYKEEDLIRLMTNLEAENLLEPQEVRLLKAAFNFDEETVGKHFKPRKKIIFLSTEMNFKEVQSIYFKYRYTRYPVLSKVEKDPNIIGIFSFKTFNLKAKNKDFYWLEFVNRKINYLDVDAKLSKAFEICQETGQHLSIVVNKKKNFIGIITLKDILETLVGKIKDENEV